jgi:hypothetical protein
MATENPNLRALSFWERKEYEELKSQQAIELRRKKDRAVMVGYFVISILATLLISGALKF